MANEHQQSLFDILRDWFDDPGADKDKWDDAPMWTYVEPDDDELIEREDNEVSEECDGEDYGAWLGQGERIIPNRPS